MSLGTLLRHGGRGLFTSFAMRTGSEGKKLANTMKPANSVELPLPVILAVVFGFAASLFLLVPLFRSQLYTTLDAATYLVFHTIVELFSVIVLLSIFGVGWYTFDQSKNHHALFLSAACLAIGLIDIMHILSFPGMPFFITPSSANKGILFWICARLTSGVAFLASAYIYPGSVKRGLSKLNLLTAALAVTGLAFAGVFYVPGYLPAMFVEGSGPTPVTVSAEYLVVSLFALSFAAYWRRFTRTGDRVLAWYLAAFIVCIFSELAFTLYKSAYDSYNLVGHLYKVVAFYMIYQGIFTSSVTHPYVQLVDTGERLRVAMAERQRAYRDLQESENLYRRITEGLTDYQYSVRIENGRAVETTRSPACAKVTGYTPEEFDADPYLWFRMVAPEDREPVRERVQEILTGKEIPPMEHRLCRKDGAVRWVCNTTILFKDASGKLLSYEGVVKDITDRKRAEEEIRKLNQELEQRVLDLRNANYELDTFNSTVSHDLGTPLMIIEGLTQRLAKTYGHELDQRFSDLVGVIHANVMKMEQLIHDLLAYARLGRQAMQRLPVSVHGVVTSVVDELRTIYPEEEVMIPLVPPCCGDEHMIREAFANLISNALKFSIRSTQRIVEIGGWEAAKENVYFVKDYGVGFDMQHKEKLFNVFQRLHSQEEFEGTGMGLAIVKRIIGLHGGRVWAEGTPGEGATFYVTLPRLP
jgi:PAS domain S-box-containing protein